MSTSFDEAMWRALDEDAHKLAQLMDEPEAFTAPCPACFESSGYVWEHGNDWNSGPYSVQTNIPCKHCNGTGSVPSDDPEPPEYRDIDYDDPGYVKALEATK